MGTIEWMSRNLRVVPPGRNAADAPDIDARGIGTRG
jgi:hypothetical protein